jgi:imidazolonepropionase-like amidohydrolase
MKTRLFCLLALGLLSALLIAARWGSPSQTQRVVLVLKNANLIDGISDEPRRNVTVTIRDSRIESVATAEAGIAADATVIDLKGYWLLPGFIDAHAHLANLGAARRALASGVTTARSMGVNHFVDIGIRELNHAGVADLPDVVAAGYHVRPHPAEEMFLDLPKMKDLMSGISGEQSVRRMVRAMIDRGANVIKIMATERAGLPDTDPRKRVFSEPELAAAVDEARRSGIYVAAHAHGDEGAAAAVRAGVRSIEHGTYLSEQTLAMMKERGTYLVPTIATVADLIEPGGDYDNAVLAIRGRHMLPRVRETAAKAWKMGVKIIAGSDTGYGPSSTRRMPHEVIELVGIGMPAMEAIKATTAYAAECLGIANRTGSVKPGLEADLIVIERDPLSDINSLQDVLMVINNGRVVLNRLNW